MTGKRTPDQDAQATEMDEMVAEFLLESHEGLDRMDQDLLELERDPDSPDVIARIFRVMHTIKGTVGFLGFTTTEAVAHSAESLLGGLRDQEFGVTPEIVTALLSAGDAIRRILGEIQSTGSEGAADHRAVIETLARLGGRARPAVRPRAAPPRPPSRGTATATKRVGRTRAAGAGRGRTTAAVSGTAPAAPPAADAPAFDDDAESHADAPSLAESAVRVDVGLLDELMTLVGELVLARNQIMQRTTIQQDPILFSTAQRLDAITTELQEGVMKTRMQAIGTLWVKYPRLVRDLAIECDKQVRMRTEGKDTELDRSLLEAIRDPLTHLVRNAVDHGIERAPVRAKAGKPEQGILAIRAYHEGGQVVVEVSDDGAGIEPADVRARAVETGLISAEAVSEMGDREALSLIFLPGLSTARQVTRLSGRGVGMDVVKTNVERVGGAIDVLSRPGEGTTFKLKIPLTLAIIPALLVRAGGERYAIPQVSLLELVRIAPEDVEQAIEKVHDAPVYRLRGRLLPLVSLATVLGEDAAAPERASDGAVNLVVLQADDRRFGLMVDGIGDSVEIVVKPLGPDLKSIGLFAGATIMGDGRVGLILDVMGLAQRAHVIDQIRERTPIDRDDAGEAVDDGAAPLLLFSDATGGRMAFALDLVDRLEEFPRNAIERSGPAMVIQYGDEILPLVNVTELLPEYRRNPRKKRDDGRPIPGDADERETIQVVVHEGEGRRIGVVVERIIDIVRSSMELQPASRPGVTGTLVIHDRVTEILDLPELLATRERANGMAAEVVA
jgi:two-component system chemotaxis sensor kinase CheA